jgi:iron complex outermembrane receptor protein
MQPGSREHRREQGRDMRVISTILWSTSAIALTLGATSAAAQTQPATPPDPTVQAQEQPADPEAGSPQTDDAVQTVAGGQDQAGVVEEEIVVTGLRRSLQSAQNIKRNSEQIVDAIVAEDIGKLPDVTASAALARIPGVQVNRAAAEAAQVQIRGLPDISTTYNSREIFTANDRFVAIQDFPAGSVAALEVFKSGTANLIEGGLGGQVNVRGRKPFDFRGFELSGSFNIVKFEQSGDWDWNGNILVSNRWDVGDGGEIGVLANAAMTNIDFFDSTRENDLWVSPRPATADYPAFIAPNGTGIYYGTGDRRRPSFNGAVQYRNGPLELYVDGLFQGYRGNDTNFWLFTPNFGDSTFTDVQLDEDGLPIRYTVRSPVAPDGNQRFFKTKTNTYQIGGGAIYRLTPDIRLSADIAYTKSVFTDHNVNIDYAFNRSPDRLVHVDHPDSPGGGSVDFIGFDTQNPDNYMYRGLWENKYKATGDDIQARADLEWSTEWDFLPKLMFGVRHNNRDATRRTGGMYRPSNPWVPLNSIPIGMDRTLCGFTYDNHQPDRCFPSASFDDVFDNLDELRTFQGGPGEPSPDPLATYSANEKTYAGYGQLRYEFDVGFPIDGNIGLRVVRTKDRLESNQLNTDADPDVIEEITRNNSYTDYLPNASMRMQFMPNLQGRLAYTETRTRPNFNDLSPGGSVGSPSGACETQGPTDPNCFVPRNGGNPDLQPINSRNYDATLEYYLGGQGALTFAVFRRDVRGFIFRSTETIAGDPFPIRLDAPFNSGKGKVKGLEAGFTTFFDYDWLPDAARGFGVQANYTYIDAWTELAPGMQNRLPGHQNFPGVSKHAYNLVGMYERYNISARLAYNWRSKFVDRYEDTNFGHLAPLWQDSLGQLDFSASYTPFENITFAFDALNLLAGNEPIRTYRAFAGGDGATFPWGRKYLERVFSFGVRFRLGGSAPAAPAPAFAPPPPLPPAQPAPVMEEPAPPPPPRPSPERG